MPFELGGSTQHTGAIGPGLVPVLLNGVRGHVTLDQIAALAAAQTQQAPSPASMLANPGALGSVWRTPIPAGKAYGGAAPFAGGTVMGLAVWEGFYVSRSVATDADPLPNLLYADTWSRVKNQTWKRSGNSAAQETDIRAAASNKFTLGASDPRLRYYYHTNTDNGQAESHGLPPAPTFQPVQDPAGTAARRIRVRADRPLLLNGDNDSDGHMAFFQPDGTVVETYGTIVMNNGDIVAALYSITRADAMLDSTYGGTTASLIPTFAGVVTNAEANAATLAPTGNAIPHALSLLIPSNNLKREAVYPALTWDSTNNYAGAIPMGSRLAIPPSVNLSTARTFSTHLGAAIARAAQVYGMIVVDRGGDGVSVRTEHPGAAAARGIAHPYPGVGDGIYADNNWTLSQCRIVT